jgi:hypothetical protein
MNNRNAVTQSLATIKMKMKMKRAFTFLIFLDCLFNFRCEKSIFDYRYKHIGEWDFTIISLWQTLDNTQNYIDTSSYYREITFSDNDYELNIQYS